MKTKEQWVDEYIGRTPVHGWTFDTLESLFDAIQQDTLDSQPSGIHSCSTSCQRPMCVLRRQHAAYKLELQNIATSQGGALTAAEALTTQ